jgi:hypothetical protein
MKKIMPAARRKFSFPGPVDMHRERGDEQNEKEDDEWQSALQSTKPKRTPLAISTREGKITKCRHHTGETRFANP